MSAEVTGKYKMALQVIAIVLLVLEGTVLEAIKERGEVVTKIAYGDWKRAGEHSRGMAQHAIQMVQRNLTPGGDKNGADINLALDALEMAFTRNHINAFVIVGGDSDFLALVEKRFGNVADRI